MPTIDLDKVIERCFSELEIRKRICKHFEIKDSGTAQDLASKLVKTIGQIPPAGHCWEDHIENRCVFRAAVRAIGSNNRNWATFLKHERRLKEILFGYDPAAVRERLRSDRSIEEDIKKCLPGRTVKNDSKAILRWAKLLGDSPSYYDCLANSVSNSVGRWRLCRKLKTTKRFRWSQGCWAWILRRSTNAGRRQTD